MNHPVGDGTRSQDREERGEITHHLTAPGGTRPRFPAACRRGFGTPCTGMGARLRLSASHSGKGDGGQQEMGALGAHRGGCVCFPDKGETASTFLVWVLWALNLAGTLLNNVRVCPNLCASPARGDRDGSQPTLPGRHGVIPPVIPGVNEAAGSGAELEARPALPPSLH